MSTTEQQCSSKSAKDLIRAAQEHPPKPIIEGLLHEGEILLLHGSEESFKSVFVLQVAESIAVGRRFLKWGVPQPLRVGVIETELHEARLGERLAHMFPGGDAPENLRFFADAALRDWKRQGLREKIESVQQWVNEDRIQVLMIDTANDFFRRTDNPSYEGCVGEFFDELRALNITGRLIVRHDRKSSATANPNDRIRGASEWKEDPECILSLMRQDRRTNEVILDVGKLRYAQKPEPIALWFDAETFRLTALPPVVDVLLRSGRLLRKEVIEACEKRFSLGQRKVDAMLANWSAFLIERQESHEKSFEIDFDKASEAPWVNFLDVVEPVRQGGWICNLA